MSYPYTGVLSLDRIIDAILEERRRQDAKWGEQNHPDGTSTARWLADELAARGMTDEHARDGTCTWLDILREEVFEAFAEESPALLRAELIQVATVAVQWVQAIDRRAGTS